MRTGGQLDRRVDALGDGPHLRWQGQHQRAADIRLLRVAERLAHQPLLAMDDRRSLLHAAPVAELRPRGPIPSQRPGPNPCRRRLRQPRLGGGAWPVRGFGRGCSARSPRRELHREDGVGPLPRIRGPGHRDRDGGGARRCAVGGRAGRALPLEAAGADPHARRDAAGLGADDTRRAAPTGGDGARVRVLRVAGGCFRPEGPGDHRLQCHRRQQRDLLQPR